MILDTTFVYDILREDSGAIERLVEFRDPETLVVVSALTVFEVGVGLHGESTTSRHRDTEELRRPSLPPSLIARSTQTPDPPLTQRPR